MLRSIRSRLVVSDLVVILLAMGIASGLAWTALDRAFLDVLRRNLLSEARRVAQTVEAGETGAPIPPGGDEPLPTPAPYAQSANVVAGYHTRIIDDEGVVILDLDASGTLSTGATVAPSAHSPYAQLETNLGLSPADARGENAEDDLLTRPEIRSALSGQPEAALRSYAWAPQRRILYAAYPVRSAEGSVASVVYIASPLPRLSLSVLPGYLGPQVLGAAAVAVVLAGLVGLFLARQLTRPLHWLTEAASALARGEPAPRIPPASTHELDRLGQAFNEMNANLRAAQESLAAQARQRQVILEGLADAVLAADTTGRITLANPAARTVLELASPSVNDVVRRTLAAGEPHRTEITIRGQVVELLVAPLRDENGTVTGAVAVGHDVTAYRQLDRLRSSFVSDVSHELRTPLTAIKGTIETLQDGAAEDAEARDRFLQTVARETERLIRLTNDLLLLSRADAGRLDLHLQSTELVAAARRAASQFRDQAEKKRLTILVEPPGERAPVLADLDRLHQVLVNLLSNAVKFTPAGGRISISLGRTNGQMSCTVFDTGPGFLPDQLPHVFERFYRGDRSRTHIEGEDGAGLGLSIVKAIAEAHGGHAWVENAPGKGAAVTFTLPVAP